MLLKKMFKMKIAAINELPGNGYPKMQHKQINQSSKKMKFTPNLGIYSYFFYNL